MSSQEELSKLIRSAIADPGTYVTRHRGERGNPSESVSEWGARAVLAALTGPSENTEVEPPYVHLAPWIVGEVRRWQIRSGARSDRVDYDGPADLAHEVVAGVLPMLLRRDRMLAEVSSERDAVRAQCDVLVTQMCALGRGDLVSPWLLSEEQLSGLARQAPKQMDGDNRD